MTEAAVQSFFKNKKGKAKRTASTVRTVPKRLEFTSVRGNKKTSEPGQTWQKKPNYTNYAHEINRGSILSAKQIRKIVTDNVSGIESVNATGVSIFAGLLDLGITNAIRIANEIVRQGRQQGVKSATFGHPTHASIAKSHPESKDVMTSLPTEEDRAYYERKYEQGKRRFEKIKQLPSFQAGLHLRTCYQSLMPILKKFWKDFKNAVSHSQEVGYEKPKLMTPFDQCYSASGPVPAIMQRMYGSCLRMISKRALLMTAANMDVENYSMLVPGARFLIESCHKWNKCDTYFYMLLTLANKKGEQRKVKGNAFEGSIQELLTQNSPEVDKKMNQLWNAFTKRGRLFNAGQRTVTPLDKELRKATAVYKALGEEAALTISRDAKKQGGGGKLFATVKCVDAAPETGDMTAREMNNFIALMQSAYTVHTGRVQEGQEKTEYMDEEELE